MLIVSAWKIFIGILGQRFQTKKIVETAATDANAAPSGSSDSGRGSAAQPGASGDATEGSTQSNTETSAESTQAGDTAQSTQGETEKQTEQSASESAATTPAGSVFFLSFCFFFSFDIVND